jgi:FKBP-type peptidyl-prolyl cis-trans isomerase 2
MIQMGNVVSVHYTGKLTDGEMFDSSEGRDPLTFQMGSGQIIPGFETALVGKNVGDKVTINIQPDDAYGQVREDLIVKVDKSQMPGDVYEGMSLQAQAEDGQAINVTVKEVYSDHVMIDGNHPLAGKELVFDIEVVSVQ